LATRKRPTTTWSWRASNHCGALFLELYRNKFPAGLFSASPGFDEFTNCFRHYIERRRTRYIPDSQEHHEYQDRPKDVGKSVSGSRSCSNRSPSDPALLRPNLLSMNTQPKDKTDSPSGSCYQNSKWHHTGCAGLLWEGELKPAIKVGDLMDEFLGLFGSTMGGELS